VKNGYEMFVVTKFGAVYRMSRAGLKVFWTTRIIDSNTLNILSLVLIFPDKGFFTQM